MRRISATADRLSEYRQCARILRRLTADKPRKSRLDDEAAVVMLDGLAHSSAATMRHRAARSKAGLLGSISSPWDHVAAQSSRKTRGKPCAAAPGKPLSTASSVVPMKRRVFGQQRRT